MTTIEELKRLHEAAKAAPYCQKDNACFIQSNSGLWCDHCRFFFAMQDYLPALLRYIEAAEPILEAAPETRTSQENPDKGVWCGTRQKDRIVDWFGPTDFHRLRQARAELEES